MTELVLGVSLLSEAKNMCWRQERVQFHMIRPSIPAIAGIVQQINEFKRLMRVQTQLFQVEINPGRYCNCWMKVDYNQNTVSLLKVTFAVAKDIFVITFMKVKILITLQRWVGVAQPIHNSDKFLDTVRSFKIPVFDLVFLRIQIFFTFRVFATVFA